jgi:nitroreductase
MEVLEAIQARYSVRDFLSKPVPKEIIMKILTAAIYSPSGGNSQPWEIFIASGTTIKKIREAYQERILGVIGEPITPIEPPLLPGFIQERMTIIRNERLQLLGLDPADPESMKVFMEWGARLFGAPVISAYCSKRSVWLPSISELIRSLLQLLFRNRISFV